MGVSFRLPLYIVGLLLLALAAAMVPPAIVDAYADNPDWKAFTFSAAITLFIGGSLAITMRGGTLQLSIRQAFLLTALSWTVLSFFAALPFLFSDAKLHLADSVFEAVSGLTTTGSTILSGLDIRPPGILLWRALLQFVGGIGIIVMAMAFLPFLRIGGMQLFRTESSDRSEKVLPRAAEVALAIGWIYAGLTAACAVAYMLAGMTVFEAICHAMTTLSTGGYSTSDRSIANFGPAVQWIAIPFMIAGGLPFVRYIQAVRGDFGPLWRDEQVRMFLGFVALVIAVIAFQRWVVAGGAPERILRDTAFTVISVITTTGFANTDYGTWDGFALVAILMLTFFGACTGSTAGGIKIFRFQIMGLAFTNHIARLLHPHAVRPMTYGGRRVGDEDARSVLAFWATYVSAVIAIAIILAAFGLDFVTAVTGAATAVGNVGPGLGNIIGPSGNFATLPDGAKWVLALGMLLGRLELFTVLVLFVPRFWRD
jgi:trk system potassium uptake protein TrkH